MGVSLLFGYWKQSCGACRWAPAFSFLLVMRLGAARLSPGGLRVAAEELPLLLPAAAAHFCDSISSV